MQAFVEMDVVMDGVGVGRGLRTDHAGVFAKSLSAPILFAFATWDDVGLWTILFTTALELRLEVFNQHEAPHSRPFTRERLPKTSSAESTSTST